MQVSWEQWVAVRERYTNALKRKERAMWKYRKGQLCEAAWNKAVEKFNVEYKAMREVFDALPEVGSAA